MNMDNTLNESGPSRPKQLCSMNRNYEQQIEQMLFNSDSDENYDFSDSGNEYEFENTEQVSDDFESDTEIANNVPSVNTQSSTNTNNDGDWQEREIELSNFPFIKQNEMLVPIEGKINPMDYFFMLFDEHFIKLLVDETNNYAETEFLRVGAPRSRISDWKPTDKDEMLTFIALIIHTGTIKLNRLNDYWKTHHLFNFSCFSNYMSRDRFLNLLRCFHFSPNIETNNQNLPEDRLYKIRPLITYFNNKIITIYYPKKELSLDESMVLWRGRLQFRQYIQNKRHKYGIKLYMLTEPHGLVLKFAVYVGVLDDLGGKGHAANVVLHLMSEKLNNGHALYMDNFYNSFDLASKLIEKKTFCTGKLRLNRKNTPQDVVESKLKKGETVARYSQGVMIGKWKDKRDVGYISTEFKNNLIITKNRNGKEQFKPEPILNYNCFMSGIDRQDQMHSYYPFTRKTIRWYKKIGIHIIQMLLMNSFYLYNQYHAGPKISLYDFRLSILSELLPKYPKPRSFSVLHTNHFPKTHDVGKSGRPNRKRCHLCYSKGIRKDTTYFCPSCPEKPSLCHQPCFKNFHK
ncbi:piggyBac transposable element-derived protein 4-like [Sipha flava]|uniref:PiggyBac transposable element-derived protein 4-like n=1 Tax=Sipha flava TaxID=143950 RepID=A0A8B8GJ77_9HEMI|nr:piggyBac transposable element-derived protein 4-like [Sipha flava]